MRGVVIIAALAATLTAPGPYNDGWPPARFTANRMHIDISLTSAEVVNLMCGQPPAGMERHACSNSASNMIFIRNPCGAAPTDDYARDLCHELGHLNGWPPDHPR